MLKKPSNTRRGDTNFLRGRALTALLVVGIALWGVSCITSSDSGSGNPVSGDDYSTGTGNEPVFQDYSYRYTAGSDSIFVYIPQSIEEHSYCDDSSLVVEMDTSDADTAAIAYRLSGNTLEIVAQESDDSSLTDTSLAGFVYSRKTPGTGVVGEWEVTHVLFASGIKYRSMSFPPGMNCMKSILTRWVR